MFTACGLNEALEYLKTNGVDVICIGVACELCARGIPKEEKKGLDGKAAFFHAILFLMLYVWDRKAHNRKLGLRDRHLLPKLPRCFGKRIVQRHSKIKRQKVQGNNPRLHRS